MQEMETRFKEQKWKKKKKKKIYEVRNQLQ